MEITISIYKVMEITNYRKKIDCIRWLNQSGVKVYTHQLGKGEFVYKADLEYLLYGPKIKEFKELYGDYWQEHFECWKNGIPKELNVFHNTIQIKSVNAQNL